VHFEAMGRGLVLAHGLLISFPIFQMDLKGF
jgi:hypothetical protein